jgi:DNA gyrase/topoisomerase IV subunit A
MADLTFGDLARGAWRDRALYTVEARAIPSLVDGLKPVQRMLLWQGLRMCKGKWVKTAAVAGTLAAVGYHHGEQAAADALIGMAASHSNNIPLFDGDGNFGNKLEPGSAAAPRYTMVRVSEAALAIYQDMDLAPAHPDPDILAPKAMLPLIPMVLVNGCKGIATGFACDIPPHDPLDLLEICHGLADGLATRTPKPRFPGFVGPVITNHTKHILQGLARPAGPGKALITELPYGMSASAYCQTLEQLCEKGAITNYEDSSSNNKFKIMATFPKNSKPDDLVQALKLQSHWPWNLTAISLDGKLLDYNTDGVGKMVEDFYNVRIGFVGKRIQARITALESALRDMDSKLRFSKDVSSGRLKLGSIKDDSALKDVLVQKYGATAVMAAKLASSPASSFSLGGVARLEDAIASAEAALDHYKSTTPEAEYKADLGKLRPMLAEQRPVVDD